MRIVSGIDIPLADEHVIGTDPALTASVSGFWRRRINPFTGRSLSDRALAAEQDTRAGMQRLRGQSVSAGVIGGLDVLAEAAAFGAAPAAAVIQVLPGSGLTRAGEDVIVATPRRIALAGLPVYARVDHLDAITSGAPAGSTSDAPAGSDDGSGPRFAPRPRRTGPLLGEILGQPAAADVPRAAVLVAEPVTAVLQANPRDTCPPDSRDDPYDDLQRIDGCRLTLYFWPTEVRARAGGPDYALPVLGPLRRNRIAYDVFRVEIGLTLDDAHPWDSVGVPLAVIGFKEDWTLDFIDRGAVLRLGGRPKPRTSLVPASGTPLLWQARVAQFMEHLTALPDFLAATFVAAFRQLPPVGFLPVEMVDLVHRRQAVFPAGFSLTVAPVPVEQIGLAVEESAGLVPINLDVPDSVELLVPVPGGVYEPGLLEIATVDPGFSRARARYVADRTDWLVRRELVRRRRDLLRDAATGQRPAWPADDLPDAETNPYPDSRGPVTSTRVRRIVAGTETRIALMLGAGSSLTVNARDRIYVWVRVADAGGLTGLSLRIGRNTKADGTGDFSFGVFWGDAAGLTVADGDPNVALRRQGPLPQPARWVRLESQADSRWTAAAITLAGFVANGIELAQRGGTIEWGPVGRITADGMETVWIADDAPQGATLQQSRGAGWPQVPAGEFSMPTETEVGTVEDRGVRQAVPIRDLRARWTQGFLAAEFALLDEGGIDGLVTDVEARLRATNDAVDLGFVRARADIYRVRQLLLGADAASRLVTSPTLADLSVRDESARARSSDLASYIKTAYQTDFRRDPNAPLDTKPRLTTAPPAAGPAAAIESSLTGAIFSTEFLTMPRLVERTDAFSPVRLTAEREPVISVAAISAATFTRFGIGDVRGQLALPGLVERTATVAERLTPPPSVEAYNSALAGKLTALDALAGLIGSAAAVERPKGIALGDLPVPGYRFKPTTGPAAPRIKGSVADVLADLERPATEREYEDQDHLPESSARHEADYFNAAVRAIDNAIALMRLVEGRVTLYENLVADARAVRDDLLRYIASADARLRTIDVEIEEARHDVGVAAALLAEEQSRVEGLNARRQATVARHVTTVMFRRPPRADRTDELPILETSPALAPSPVGICLGEHDAVPEEIRDYVALFREAPVAWFPAVHDRVRIVDRLEAARATLASARIRAAALPTARVFQAATSTRLLEAVARTTTAQATIFERSRLATLQLDLGLIAAMDLSTAHRALAERATLGDLAAGDHNRPELSRLAVSELDQMAQVAACLHDAFAESAPVIRLGWAEMLSEFDAPAPLSQLAGLPRWSELPLELRRMQQGLVDFLFSRIDRMRGEAAAAISGLVRVCLLMASHAPVDRVIATRLVTPAPARLGARLDLAVDVRLARIGQVALVRGAANAVIARAVVEDLADGIARARITESYQPTVTIAAGVRVELSENGFA
jgi:hypothetical protein